MHFLILVLELGWVVPHLVCLRLIEEWENFLSSSTIVSAWLGITTVLFHSFARHIHTLSFKSGGALALSKNIRYQGAIFLRNISESEEGLDRILRKKVPKEIDSHSIETLIELIITVLPPVEKSSSHIQAAFFITK